ncbi:hypothetical protein CC1G_11102 [Coprinopsis cinerea okayama7|uniref:Cytosolic endo-beta-N-acetylglucosaminidase TIM barrel domain-containing protein n=1 Tax=Coprinopsis cinerea (strain Okayama-7 / 130 / ATCC MYA-4618 / FGSC 9003) TaxID=240176 RepID=A8P7P2_COPC7|nr:hypothetical protein CC1G_11102 [Coprinopsis cinerea okayama7\|eukprot:XP_001839402.1 hypothetical protein CC1G_11102 [Coprinopsis cinerea okayama7\
MPIAGKKFHPRALPEFWRTFREMDEWRATQTGPQARPAEGILKYVPRKIRPADIAGKGRLLVSHDYKGGYVEDPFSKSYSFNWWFSTDSFNYFAHHRITIPPPEWINAAHRQGVPILGTIIFEGGSDEDILRMVIGKTPGSTSNFHAERNAEYTVPVSSYYAELFADLAVERGFDGWLLNVEIGLQGGSEQARGLAAWVALLQQEVLKKVGPHGLVIWYDSVTVRGDLWWQDRLNAFNLPFFLNSSGIFTNYWWYNDAPQKQIDFLSRVDPNLTGQTAEPHQYNLQKTIQDIYIGVDVWGRGSHGGGGFGAYKAIEHADPKGLGFSVALFAQGWTWETEEEKPGWNWAQFWDYDSKLWVGPPGVVEAPDHTVKPGEYPCVHGPFQPISSFFLTYPPPDPLDLPFYTNFCPGIGDAWFVEGKEVFRSETGWTDMDKQTTVGDLVWPRPKIYDLPSQNASQATLNAAFNFNDAWNGGNSLQINLTVPGGATTYGAYWVPIQTFTFSSRRQYEASIVYKPGLSGKTRFDAKYEVGIRTITGEDQGKIISNTTTEVGNGWRKVHILFEIETPVEGGSIIVPSSIGLVIAVSNVSTTEQFEFPFLVGQITIHPHLPDRYKEFKPALLWLLFTPSAGTNSLDGTLTWDVVAAIERPPPVEINNPDDAQIPWNLQPTKQEWFPDFLYFNVYVLELLDGGGQGPPQWIGTTGYDGEKKRFFIYDESLPPTSGLRRFTFQIEGVLETGESTHWYDAPAAPSATAGGEQKRTRRTSLKSVLSPLRRKKSKGDISVAK